MSRLQSGQPGAGDGLTAILGAGALGQLWAGYLALAPAGNTATRCRVGFVARPGTNPASLCYQLQTPQGQASEVSVSFLDPATDRPSLLLVTTKATDVLSALKATLPSLPEAVPLVLFQNGMGSQQAVAAQWPDRPVLAASTTEGANRPEPGLTVHAGRGQTWIGAMTPAAEPLLSQIVTLLGNTGLAVMPEPDIRARLWQKLIINAGINAFTALLDCPNGGILTASVYLQWIDELCNELHQVMTAEGLQSPGAGELRQKIEAVARSTATNTSSMRADVLRGRTTEIDYINGYVADRGKALNIATPVNQILRQQVQQLSVTPGPTAT